MTPLWTHRDAEAATGGASTRPWNATGVAIDSRAVGPGELFVALNGPQHDGHDFVAAAMRAGAAAAMVHRRPELPAGAALLQVADTQAALEALGKAGRDRSTGKVIAVTGSVGKTGTKEALKAMLAAQAPTHAAEKSFNNHWGLPLTLARLPQSAHYAVLELGMNRPGEIAMLTRIARPHVALVTTVEAVHLEYFGSVEAIADAKAEIFDGVEPGGTAVLNHENRQFERLAGHARRAGIADIRSFGTEPGCDARLVSAEPDGTGALAVRLAFEGRKLDFRLGLGGRHLALNVTGALLAAAAAGADIAQAMPVLADLRPPRGRGALVPLALADGTATLVDESYNASPVAVRAALASLSGMAPGPGGRRIVVLGDMRELGPTAPTLHAGLADAVRASGAGRVFTCGPLMAHLAAALPGSLVAAHAPDSAALAPLVAAAIRPGDVVMVKGSLGSRMAVIVDALQALGAGAVKH